MAGGILNSKWKWN